MEQQNVDPQASDLARRAFCAELVKIAGGSDAPAASLIWQQCSGCGKWRRISKRRETENSSPQLWFCVQNTFSDRLASCTAPQESAIDIEFELAVQRKLVIPAQQVDEEG